MLFLALFLLGSLRVTVDVYETCRENCIKQRKMMHVEMYVNFKADGVTFNLRTVMLLLRAGPTASGSEDG